jgi:outer membrane lipopolysaccharide assembly protein LptE/RlpB
MQNKFFYIVAAIVLALLSVLASCGYRFTPVGGVVPEGMKTIAVPVFINGTNEPFVDTELTQAVVDEFLFDGRLKVVSLERADIVLRGKVIKFDLAALSYTADSHVQQYMVNMSVNVSIEDAKSKKILWQEEGLSSVFVSSYPVALGDITATKIAKESAVKKVCRDIATTLRSRVLEGF